MQRHALPCSYMLRSIPQACEVDSRTDMRLPHKAACIDWMRADAAAVQKIPGRV